MDGMLDEFRAVAEKLAFHPARIPLVSTLTGRPAGEAELRDPGYWVRHARETVRFADAVTALAAAGVAASWNSAPTPTSPASPAPARRPTAPSSSRSAAATAVNPPPWRPAWPACSPTASPPTGPPCSPARPAPNCPPTPSGTHATG
ncbi:hypothetical protein ACFQ3Z_05160 [Streptomyces nogalater]